MEAEETGVVFFSHQVLGGVPWAVISKAVLFFVYFGVSILTVRSLGPEKFGVFSLCKNIGEYLVVVCGLGLNTALVRFIPELTVGYNRAGLVRFLWKSWAMQTAMVAVTAGVLWVGQPVLNAWFGIDFGHLLLFTMLLVAAQVGKDFVNDSYTAMFRVQTASILSICQGLLWFGLLAWVLPALPQVQTALLVQAGAATAVSVVGFGLLFLLLRRLDWRSPTSGIGMRRALSISLSSLFNSMANMLMRKYTEVFFLGTFFSPAVVGMFDLGYTMPFLVITFLPLAVQKLFTSGFAEAYARDEACLGHLISFFYKALILTVVPVAVFGAFFAPRAIVLFYGPEMERAGTIAAVFFVFHVLQLVYIPQSMAVVAREKIFQMLPLTILQIVVKLVLDYALIPRFEIQGAVAAALGSFFLTIPVHLYVVHRILGGIYFPGRFLVKTTLPLMGLAFLLWPLSAHLGILGLFGVGMGYVGIYGILIRKLRLIRREDIAELTNLGFDRLNRFLDFFARG